MQNTQNTLAIKTPILFVIFNRPEFTQKVFDAIRQAKPSKLYIIADGPRDSHPKDKELCEQTLKIVEHIDWPCEVKRNYSEKNMGCGPRISSGITWAFEYTDQLIVIEDDCVPNLDFFVFMEEMLEKYKDNTQIGTVTGFSPKITDLKNYPFSYYFSKFYYMWGWGTWKRVWDKYEYKLDSWKEKSDSFIFSKIEDKIISRQIARDFNNVYQNNETLNNVNTWDFQLMYTHFKYDLFCIKSRENLIENLGVGVQDATHTILDNPIGDMQHQGLKTPLIHQSQISWTKDLDLKVFRKYVQRSEFMYFLKQFIKKIPFAFKILKFLYLLLFSNKITKSIAYKIRVFFIKAH